jgi:surface antigen
VPLFYVSHSVPGRRAQIFRARLGAVLAGVCAGTLGACSIAMPQSPRGDELRGEAEDVTGSIRKPAVDLPLRLDAEDRRRAFAALATALDPQGEGAEVTWENPQTGARGGFTPVGLAYPIDGKVCRAFLAEVGGNEQLQRLQGTACRERTNDWSLSQIGAWRKG